MSVFKLRRPKSQWASPEVPEFYDTYYMKLHGAEGKQMLRNTHATDKALAAKVEAAARRKVREEGWQGLLDALEPVKARRTLATLGDIETAYLKEGVQIVKQDKAARDNVASLFRVVAWSQGLWTAAGEGMKGIKPGTRVHDAARIRKLSAGVLTGELVRGYFRERQGGKELDVSSRKAENRSINSTLNHARQVFSKRARAYKMGKLQLPDLDGFMEEPMLPAADRDAQRGTGGAARELADEGGQGMGDRDPGPEGETRGAGGGGKGREDFVAGLFPEGGEEPQGASSGGSRGHAAGSEGVSDRAGPDEYGPERSGEPDTQCLVEGDDRRAGGEGAGKPPAAGHGMLGVVEPVWSSDGAGGGGPCGSEDDEQTLRQTHGHSAGRDGEGAGCVGPRQCGQPAGSWVRGA